MTETTTRRPDLAQVLDLFPEKSVAVRERFLRDEAFRGLCEDYALARDTLVRFEAMPDADHRPEVPDYRTVISELETEIATALADPPDRGRRTDPTNSNNVNPRRTK